VNAKPGDLLLSVIEFFGILVPGAAFALLHGDRLWSPFGVYDWTHRLVFDFFLQLHAPPRSSPPRQSAGGKN
jgi:hypothetical protein